MRSYKSLSELPTEQRVLLLTAVREQALSPDSACALGEQMAHATHQGDTLRHDMLTAATRALIKAMDSVPRQPRALRLPPNPLHTQPHLRANGTNSASSNSDDQFLHSQLALDNLDEVQRLAVLHVVAAGNLTIEEALAFVGEYLQVESGEAEAKAAAVTGDTQRPTFFRASPTAVRRPSPAAAAEDEGHVDEMQRLSLLRRVARGELEVNEALDLMDALQAETMAAENNVLAPVAGPEYANCGDGGSIALGDELLKQPGVNYPGAVVPKNIRFSRQSSLEVHSVEALYSQPVRTGNRRVAVDIDSAEGTEKGAPASQPELPHRRYTIEGLAALRQAKAVASASMPSAALPPNNPFAAVVDHGTAATTMTSSTATTSQEQQEAQVIDFLSAFENFPTRTRAGSHNPFLQLPTHVTDNAQATDGLSGSDATQVKPRTVSAAIPLKPGSLAPNNPFAMLDTSSSTDNNYVSASLEATPHAMTKRLAPSNPFSSDC